MANHKPKQTSDTWKRSADLAYMVRFEGMTLAQAGKKYGLTRERVRQIIKAFEEHDI